MMSSSEWEKSGGGGRINRKSVEKVYEGEICAPGKLWVGQLEQRLRGTQLVTKREEKKGREEELMRRWRKRSGSEDLRERGRETRESRIGA